MRENQSVWPFHEIGARAKDLVIEFLDATKQDVRPRIGVHQLAGFLLRIRSIKQTLMRLYLKIWVLQVWEW